MVPNAAEIVRALRAALRLARFDEGGLAEFDVTYEGFWRSFFAALLVAPGYALLVMQKWSVLPEPPVGPGAVLAEAFGYLLGWIAFPLALIPLTQLLGLGQRYVVLVVATNWSKVVQMIAFLLAIGLAAGSASEAGGLLVLIATGAILVYQWFVTRVALACSAALAAGVVVLDVVVSLLISRLTDGLL